MCQLLGMNCNVPTDIGFSFAGFRKRGGLTDHHEDGFGIAFLKKVAVQKPVTAWVYAYFTMTNPAIHHPLLT